MVNENPQSRQGVARFELLSALVIRTAEFSHALDNKLDNYRYQQARSLSRQRSQTVYVALGTGASALVLAYAVSEMTNKVIGQEPLTAATSLFGMIAIIAGIVGFNYATVLPAALPRRFRGARLKEAYLSRQGGVGAISGLLFYHEDEEIANMLQRHIDSNDVTKDDDVIIKTLLLEGSELTVDQLIATARSLR